MTKHLYLTLAMVPALAHAMEEKKNLKTLASMSAIQGSQDSGSSSSSGRRSSLPNVFDYFKKKSSHVSKGSTGSLDLEHLDGSSLESATSPRATTPRSGGMARGNARLTRSSADGTVSPRLSVSFNAVAAGKDDHNNHICYEIDKNGFPVPIDMGYIDEDDSAPTSPSAYSVDPNGRKNPDFKDPKERTCKSPDTLSGDVKKKVLSADGQCPVGADAFGAPQVAQKVKYSPRKAVAYRIVAEGDVSQDQFASQASSFSYHVAAGNDDVDPAIVALAAAAPAAEHQAEDHNKILDDLIAAVKSTSISRKRDDDDDDE